MKKTKLVKLIVTFIIIIFYTIQMSIVSSAKTPIPSPSENDFVNDFAQVLSEDEIMRLIDNATELYENYSGVEVVISTIKTLKEYTLDDFYTKDFLEQCSKEEIDDLITNLPQKFATEMYNQYEIGSGDLGILILLVIDEENIQISIGKSMEAYISNSKAERFVDVYALDYFIDGNLGEGLINLQEAFISEIQRYIPKETMSTDKTEQDSSSNFVVVFLIIFIIYFVYKIMKNDKNTYD